MKRFLVAAVYLLLAACGQSGSADSSDSANPVAQVRTAVAVAGNAAQTVIAYGVAEQAAANEHALTTQAEATLARIVAPTGTAVGAGQVVAILSPSPSARLDLGKAATDARAAEAVLARAIRLKKDGLASDADVNNAQAAYQNAAQTLTARQRSSTLVLRAPVAGTVQGLTAKPGDLLPAGTAVASIGARGDLRARLGVDPSVAARVRAGQPVTIAATDPASTITTNVIGVDPMVDPTSHLASIFAPLPGTALGAGEPVHATITVSGGGGGGVIVPYSALMEDGGRTYVFVVRNGIASRRDVTPGNSSGDTIQILNGVEANERVVTEGGTALEDGMRVHDEGSPRAARRAG